MDSNLFWCIIGIIGGAIVSFIISLLFYFIGLKRKRLIYDVKTFNLISDKINQINGLEVTYDSKEINNLYSSTITIKNIGNSIIEKQDFAPSCPLSISTDGKFLVDQSNSMSLFPLNKTNSVCPLFDIDDNNVCNHIIISFDYISKKEELTCSVFHTGNISFNGVLKEGKIFNNNDNINSSMTLKNFSNIFALCTGIVVLLALIITFSNSMLEYKETINDSLLHIENLNNEIDELRDYVFRLEHKNQELLDELSNIPLIPYE